MALPARKKTFNFNQRAIDEGSKKPDFVNTHIALDDVLRRKMPYLAEQKKNKHLAKSLEDDTTNVNSLSSTFTSSVSAGSSIQHYLEENKNYAEEYHKLSIVTHFENDREVNIKTKKVNIYPKPKNNSSSLIWVQLGLSMIASTTSSDDSSSPPTKRSHEETIQAPKFFGGF